MSFSQTVKEELFHYPLENMKSNESEMIAIINNVGRISVNNDITELKIMTENVAICKRFYEIAKKLYDESMKVDIVKLKKQSKKNLYTVIVNDKNIIESFIDKLINPGKYIKDKRAYLRGCFLSIGSVTDPQKEYHLEFVCNDMKNAKLIQELLSDFELTSKIINRKNDYIVYIKESNQIADLLNIIYAHNALLKMEDIRVQKEMINNVNRAVNCETANLKKTVSASIKQIKDIKKIMKSKTYASLPSGLKEVAEYRLNNPEASLQEIAEILGLSKSCVNHRLRKLIEISEQG